MGQGQKEKLPIVLVLALFFVSGALALVYQVVWARMMMQVFGSTAVAVGTVLAAFMSGLAAGSWMIGRFADRSLNCLQLYARLEIGIAITAGGFHWLLSHMGPAHLALYGLFGYSGAAWVLARFFLAFMLVLAPTVLMGATLPVLTRFLLNRPSLVGVNLSTLYSTNTFGAVAGVLLTGFVLIGKFGIHIPVYIAVIGNLAIGLIALVASRRFSDVPATESPREQSEEIAARGRSPQVPSATVRLVVLGLGISGFTSFAYEIYWTRSLVFILGNSTYALTTMLSAFLTGIALGGYLVRFFLSRFRDRAAVFGWTQVSIGIFSALALPLLFFIAEPQTLNQYLSQHSDRAFLLIFASYGVAFLVMLVPATLIGATFPLVGQIAVSDLRKAGSDVGRIYAVNTLGNVLGALLPGFFLISWLGIQKGILAMAAINVSLGMIVLSVRLLRPARSPAWRLVLPLVLLGAAVLMSRAPLQFQFPSDEERPWFQTVFYREGPLATTKVYRDPRSTELHMSVDGIVIGGTGFSQFKQLLLAHLPKLLLKDVSSELSVGLGSGILAGESARHSQVAEITVVEIEPSVVDGAKWFSKENHDVLENPRVRIIIDDIGNFLRTTPTRYQVITADEKTADEYASNGFSYSLDYYNLLREHLAPGGLVAQWVPTTLPPEQYRMVVKTFSQGFPHMQLWYFLPAYKRGPFNTLLIGSNEPIEIDYGYVDSKLAAEPTAFSSLLPFGLTSAGAILPHFVADEKAIGAALATVPVNSLDHPRYEFFYPWDYAIDRNTKFIANHELIRALRRKASPEFLSRLAKDPRDLARLKQSWAAEDRYLLAFQQFLTGLPLSELYRLFDETLSMAPWNDSLRAQVYSLYSYIASAQSDPAMRASLWKRADSLYRTTQ